MDYQAETTFDTVYFSGLLQLLNESDVIEIVEKAYTWLKPNGLLITRDSVVEQYTLFHRNQPEFAQPRNYSCYRKKAKHLAFFPPSKFALLKERDSCSVLPIILPFVIRKFLSRKAYTRICEAYYAAAYRLEPMLFPLGRIFDYRRLRHKFFVFRRL